MLYMGFIHEIALSLVLKLKVYTTLAKNAVLNTHKLLLLLNKNYKFTVIIGIKQCSKNFCIKFL